MHSPTPQDPELPLIEGSPPAHASRKTWKCPGLAGRISLPVAPSLNQISRTNLSALAHHTGATAPNFFPGLGFVREWQLRMLSCSTGDISNWPTKPNLADSTPPFDAIFCLLPTKPESRLFSLSPSRFFNSLLFLSGLLFSSFLRQCADLHRSNCIEDILAFRPASDPTPFCVRHSSDAARTAVRSNQPMLPSSEKTRPSTSYATGTMAVGSARYVRYILFAFFVRVPMRLGPRFARLALSGKP